MSQTTSQHSFPQIVSNWSDEKCAQEAKVAIPQLLVHVDVTDHTFQELFECVNILTEKFLSHVFQQALGKVLLETVCLNLVGALDSILIQLPGEDASIAQPNLSSLTDLLKDAVKVIQCLENIIRRLTSLMPNLAKGVDIVDVSPVPRSTVTVLQRSYYHCKNSEKSYGKIFKHTSNALGSLFQKTFTLQKSLSWFFSKIILPEDVRDVASTRGEVIEVLDGLLCVCEVIDGMDNMLQATSWKLLFGILETFQSIIKQHLSLVRYISVLCRHAECCIKYTLQLFSQSSHLLSTGDELTRKALDRSSKFSIFFMTSLSDLIKLFEADLTKDSCIILVILIQNIYKLVESDTQIWRERDHDVKDMKLTFLKDVSSGIEGVGVMLISAESFICFFMEQDDFKNWELGTGSLNFVMCGVKLLAAHHLNSARWFEITENGSPAHSMLKALMDETIHAMVDLDVCDSEADELPFYDSVIVDFCALASSLTEDVYALLEVSLLQNLFSLDFRRNILAADIITFLCRFSKFLRNHYVSLLRGILEKIVSFQFPLTIKTAIWLLLRISISSSEKDITELVFNLNICPWTATSEPVSEILWSTRKKALSNVCSEIDMKIVAMNGNNLDMKRLKSFHRLCKKLFGVVLEKSQANTLVSALTFWYNVLGKIAAHQQKTHVKFFSLLCHIMKYAAILVRPAEVCDVLKLLREYIENTSASLVIQLAVSSVLSVLGSCNFEVLEDEVCKIFSCLVMSRNWRIRHDILSHFESISRFNNVSNFLEKCALVPEFSSRVEEHFSFQRPDSSDISAKVLRWKEASGIASIEQRYEDWKSQQLELFQDLLRSEIEEKDKNIALGDSIRRVKNSLTELEELCKKENIGKHDLTASAVDDLMASENLLRVIAKRLGS